MYALTYKLLARPLSIFCKFAVQKSTENPPENSVSPRKGTCFAPRTPARVPVDPVSDSFFGSRFNNACRRAPFEFSGIRRRRPSTPRFRRGYSGNPGEGPEASSEFFLCAPARSFDFYVKTSGQIEFPVCRANHPSGPTSVISRSYR